MARHLYFRISEVALDVDQQDDPLLVTVVPCFVLCRIVEEQTFSLLPCPSFITYPQFAVPAFRDD